MNIARLLKPDERSYLFKSVAGSSAVWQVPKSPGANSTFLQHQSRAVSAPREIQDRYRKSPTQELLWVDMIANALIVVVIAWASYFLISAKAFQASFEPAVTSYSEPTLSHEFTSPSLP